MPFFSVIIPTYNRADWLGGAIQSVLNQKYAEFECIIIDDGSDDETQSVVSNFKDTRIRYYYQENQERSAARNLGIQQATGRYLCFIDSDDRYLDVHLSIFHSMIEKFPEHPLFFTDIARADLLSKSKLQSISYEILSTMKSFAYCLYEPVSCLRWCVRKDLLDKEKFDKNLNNGEDQELFLRLLKHVSEVIHIQNVTVIYQQHPGRSIDLVNTYKKNILLLERIYHENPLAIHFQEHKNRLLHGNYMALLRHSCSYGLFGDCLKYQWIVFNLRPLDNLKEKIHLIYLCLKKQIQRLT